MGNPSGEKGLRIPTGFNCNCNCRRQISWLCTSTTMEMNHRLKVELIQLVVRKGLELEISRFQGQHPNHLAMLPPVRKVSNNTLTLIFSNLLVGSLSRQGFQGQNFFHCSMERKIKQNEKKCMKKKKLESQMKDEKEKQY